MQYQGAELLPKPLDALKALFLKKICTFDWDGDHITAVAHSVEQEGTVVVKFRTWYQHSKDGQANEPGDPYGHTAALAPRLSEIKNLEFHQPPILQVGKFVIDANK